MACKEKLEVPQALVRARMTEMSITQIQLCGGLGITQGALSQWLCEPSGHYKNSLSIATRVALAEALHLDRYSCLTQEEVEELEGTVGYQFKGRARFLYLLELNLVERSATKIGITTCLESRIDQHQARYADYQPELIFSVEFREPWHAASVERKVLYHFRRRGSQYAAPQGLGTEVIGAIPEKVLEIILPHLEDTEYMFTPHAEKPDELPDNVLPLPPTLQ
ncbi:hypothetical protein OMB55_00017640 [gamma proteobacterium HIMB55]|nr:hypothetical protein OMB55_00017640 [gamma proteobacterium HIMB55]